MNRIKEVLSEKGIRQTWLSEKLDKSYNMVNSYVQNRRQPSLNMLHEIAELLNVHTSDLIVSTKEKSTPITEWISVNDKNPSLSDNLPLHKDLVHLHNKNKSGTENAIGRYWTSDGYFHDLTSAIFITTHWRKFIELP